MVEKLAKTPKGRLLIHTVVLCNNALHLRKLNTEFYFAAFRRFLMGIG